MQNNNVENRQLYQYIRDNLKTIAFEKDWTDGHLEDSCTKLMRFCDYDGNGQLDIQSIAAKHITKFVMHLIEEGNYRLKRGLSPKTANRYLAALSCLFKYAVDADDIVKMPKITFRDEGEGRIRTFSDEELQKLLDFFRTDPTYSKYKWIRDMTIVGMYTGMRRSEIKYIGSKVFVQQDDEGEYLFLPAHITKNGDERKIPIDGQLDLKEAIERLGNCSKKYTHHKFHCAWRKARKAIAPGDYSFCSHTLRHTVASNMANKQKTNVLVIADYLGHRALETTRKYVHASLEAKRDAMKGMKFGVRV